MLDIHDWERRQAELLAALGPDAQAEAAQLTASARRLKEMGAMGDRFADGLPAERVYNHPQFAYNLERRLVAFKDGREVKLTVNEGMIFEQLLAHPNMVVNSNLLVSKVWGYTPDDVTRHILQVNMHRIRAKLAGSGYDPAVSSLIRTESGIGYTLVDPSRPTLERPISPTAGAHQGRRVAG